MKWLHNLLKGLSLTTALFIFQACYGTPDWLNEGNRLPFKVVDAETGDPLEGARISPRVQPADNLDWIPCGVTGPDGWALVEFGTMDGADPQFRIWAPGTEYQVKDTVLTAGPYRDILISLNKAE